MTAGLSFDDRLWNPYAVENLQQSHPELHEKLRIWFDAIRDFDDTSLLKLINAKGADEVGKWREKGAAALEAARSVALRLEPVLRTLEQALAVATPFPEREQLSGLLEAALRNRAALLEQAPALVSEALASATAYAGSKAAASRAVEDAAKQLDAMLARSSDVSKPYRELRPMVAELAETWSVLDRALAPLSRQDQRVARSAQQERMSAAGRALCRNLFLAKMRDRKSGAWPMPEIAAPGDSAAQRLGAAIAARDFPAAADTLAPWLRDEWTVERLGREFDKSAAEIATGFDLGEAPPPGAWLVGSNPMTYQDVRHQNDAGAPVPVEVTAENFIAWHPMEIRTEDEDEYLTDIGCLMKLYTITVRAPEGQRIGHLAIAE
jgi:hypothetical protein